jgi:hypothetical protein
MARHEVFDYARDGFRRFVPPRYHEAAKALEIIYDAYARRLETSKASIRESRSQYCHYVTPVSNPGHRIAVFAVESHNAIIELYHPGALTRETRALCAHTRTGRDWARIVIPTSRRPDPNTKGHMDVRKAIDLLGEYLDELDKLIHEGIAGSSSSEGELVVFRVLQANDAGQWHHRVRPEFLRQSTQRRLELDFWNKSRSEAIEVMGNQHFRDVEKWGGNTSRIGSNERTRLKVRACMDHGVALVFARWMAHTDSVLGGRGEGYLWQLIRKALSRASEYNRWVDLDELDTGSRFNGYAFLRANGLPSALDEV